MDTDLLDIITDPELGGITFAYERIFESVDDKGRATFAAETFEAAGNIQPAPGKEREALEDSERLKAAILIFCPVDLIAGKENERADRVFYRGDAYRVALAEPWQEHGGFTKAVAVLEERGAQDA